MSEYPRSFLEKFFHRLEGPEGCDFQGEGQAQTWRCAGGHDQRYARAILATMGLGPAATEQFLARCTELGGHCDCEILFNARERMLAAALDG